MSIALLLVSVSGFRNGATGTIAVTWFIIGNLLYCSVGIVLAYKLKDNHALCKYVCPVSVLLKIISPFSVIRIGQGMGLCNDCDACVILCPMDVRISDYILNIQRVLSNECSLCQTCSAVCAQDALKFSFGFDKSREGLLRERTPKVFAETVAAD